MTMTFKEAMIAHLQGQKVQVFHTVTGVKKLWEELIDENYFGALISGADKLYSFRLAPNTILVNGVEVPAPEKDAPQDEESYFLVQSDHDEYALEMVWTGHDCDWRWLRLGLVYLDQESAIARAKAMLITQEVK